MTVRLEDWLDQMRQARDPGPFVRVLVVRNGHSEWTFDVTDNTDLDELAVRIEGSIRDANCKRCEMRAVDAEDQVIDHFTFRPDQAVLAQVVNPGGFAIPFEVSETITASLKTHRSFAALGLKGIAENQEHTRDIIADLRKQNSALLEALTQARRDRTEEVTAVRAENGGEITALRKENAELRERVSKQWQMEDDLRSKHVDKQLELEKSRVFGRLAE